MPNLCRKRIWLLAIVALLIVGAMSIFWAWGKSDFEQRFDRIQPGMKLQGAIALIQHNRAIIKQWSFPARAVPYTPGQYVFVEDGERATLLFEEDERIIEKKFEKQTMAGRLRQYWIQLIKTTPPF